MSTRLRQLAFVLGVATLTPAQSRVGSSQPWDLAAWLPAETALLIECDDLPGTVAVLRRVVGRLPPRAVLAEVALATALKLQSGHDLDGLLRVLTPGKVAFGLALPADGRPLPILLTRLHDVEAAREVVDLLPHLGAEFRDGWCALFPDVASLARWRQCMANGPKLSARHDGRRQPASSSTGLRLFLDLALLRQRRGSSLWAALDAGARVLVGPLVAALDTATRLDAEVTVQGDAVCLRGALDATALRAEPQRHLLACGATPRPTISLPPDALAVVRLDRSLHGYLSNLDALLPPAVAAQVRGEAANLDLIIGGGSFVGELLPGLGEPAELVVVAAATPSADDDALPRPRVHLPGVALVVRIDTERARELLTKGFYRLSAILAAQRAQRRLPPRLAQRLDEDGLRLHVMRGIAFQGSGEPPTDEQIEATLLFGASHVVLATTPACAKQVYAALQQTTADVLVGDEVRLFGPAIAATLHRNHSVLVAGRVLDEGEDPGQAEAFVRGLLAAIEMAAELRISVVPAAQATTFSVTLRRAP